MLNKLANLLAWLAFFVIGAFWLWLEMDRAGLVLAGMNGG